MILKSNAKYIIIIITILFVLTCTKILMQGNSEYLLAEDHFSKNEISKAIVHYERAIHWFIPFSPTPDRAARKLWSIAQSQQNLNQNSEALKTYRILRSAFYSVRSVYTPGKHWIGLCNEKIAYLMTIRFMDSQESSELNFAEKKSQFLKLLETKRPPFTFPSIMSEVGFFGWISSILLFIFMALSPQGHIKKRPATLFISTFLVFYSIWIWGLFNA